jgi:hypothetical protein
MRLSTRGFAVLGALAALMVLVLLLAVAYESCWEPDKTCVQQRKVHIEASTTVVTVHGVPVYTNRPAYDSNVCTEWAYKTKAH